VSLWKWVQKYSSLADRLSVVNKRAVRKIFVDETLLQIDGQNYWLWTAYEPNLDACLMMHLSREKGQFLFAIDSSNNYSIGMVGNPFSQMVRNGIMKLVGG
jgi:hypothetical protein